MTKSFRRFARKAGIDDRALFDTATAVSCGEHDVDLGGGIFKQRVARRGEGKSGGFRAIVVFRIHGHVFFVYGFAKSRRTNIDDAELRELRRLADVLTRYADDELKAAVSSGELFEIEPNGRKNEEAI